MTRVYAFHIVLLILQVTPIRVLLASMIIERISFEQWHMRIYSHDYHSFVSFYPHLKSAKMTAQSFMIFLFRFYWAEAFGIWSDMDHYIYMVLFGILSEHTLVYAMMAYFTLPTIQSSFMHSNLHHSKMLFWGIAIYYYMMFRFGLFFRRLRYANSFVIQIWFLQNISHFRSLPDFSALFTSKLLFSPDA